MTKELDIEVRDRLYVTNEDPGDMKPGAVCSNEKHTAIQEYFTARFQSILILSVMVLI